MYKEKKVRRDFGKGDFKESFSEKCVYF